MSRSDVHSVHSAKASGERWFVANAHRAQTPFKDNAIAVADKIYRRLLPAACLVKLAGNPSAVGYAVTPNHNILRRSWRIINKIHRRDINKIHRRDVIGMIAQKCSPLLRRPLSAFRHILATEVWSISIPSLSNSPWMRQRLTGLMGGRGGNGISSVRIDGSSNDARGRRFRVRRSSECSQLPEQCEREQ